MKNYSSMRLELLGLKWAVTEKFKEYLYGSSCVVYVTQLRSGEDPELRNTLKNASYRGGRAAKCFKYSPTKGDGGVRAIRSSPG